MQFGHGTGGPFATWSSYRSRVQPTRAAYACSIRVQHTRAARPSARARASCVRGAYSHPELDGRLPLSSVLWHLLFWGMTSNHTILPDGHGSATFKAMLVDLNLIDEVFMARQVEIAAPHSRSQALCRSVSRHLLMRVLLAPKR